MAKVRDYEMAEGKGYTHVRGVFFPNAGSNPTFGTGAQAPVGWTAVRASAGTWTITFTEKYAGLVSAMATIQMNAATDLVPQFGAFTAASGSTPASIVLRANAVATPTDIAANANNSVSFDICFAYQASTK